jgi:hypothetical protein
MEKRSERISNIVRNGRKIVIVDISHARPDEAIAILRDAAPVVSAHPEKSALLLTDVTSASYNKESAEAMKNYSARNTPFVRASAVVGADGLRAVLLSAVRVLTGRDIRAFPDRDSAIAWLVSRE